MGVFHDFEMQDFKKLTSKQVEAATEHYRCFLLYEAGKIDQDFYFNEMMKQETDWDMLPAKELQKIKQAMIDDGQITEADLANA